MSNQYSREPDARASNAIHQLDESKERTKQAITQAEAVGVPPFQQVANPNPPTSQDIRGDFSPQPWIKPLRAAHAAILEYWSEIKPFRHHAPELWEEPLITINHPTEGNWETEKRRHKMSIQKRGLDYREVELSLQNLGQYRSQQVNLSLRNSTRQKTAHTIDSRAEKVFLPMVAVHAAYDQINDIRKQVGLTIDVGAAKRDGEPTGAPWESEESEE